MDKFKINAMKAAVVAALFIGFRSLGFGATLFRPKPKFSGRGVRLLRDWRLPGAADGPLATGAGKEILIATRREGLHVWLWNPVSNARRRLRAPHFANHPNQFRLVRLRCQQGIITAALLRRRQSLIVVFRERTGRLLWFRRFAALPHIYDVVVARGGSRLVLFHGHSLLIYALRRARLLRTIAAAVRDTRGIALGKSCIVQSSIGGRVLVWNTRTWRASTVVPRKSNAAFNVAVNRGGNCIALCDPYRSRLTILTRVKGKWAPTDRRISVGAGAPIFSPSGRRLLTFASGPMSRMGVWGTNLDVYGVKNGTVSRQIKGSIYWGKLAAAWLPGGRRFVGVFRSPPKRNAGVTVWTWRRKGAKQRKPKAPH